MSILRSERFAALFLIGAAALGLLLANTAAAPALDAALDFHLGAQELGIDLSLRHWVTDGLLAVFFFIAAIELKHELRHGELDSAKKALVPALAAVGGVILPALLYLLVVGDGELAVGWPIPTATDIAFALGVLALVGRGLPPRVRALLLALAVIDDLIAILIIAFFFTNDLAPLPLLLAVPVVLAFGWLSHRMRAGGTGNPGVVAALIVLGAVAWLLVSLSGIHPTIAGVALGLIMADGGAARARHLLEPVSNGFILPVFAFVAALVPLPSVGIDRLSPAFWGILIALPIGKLLGITAGALIAGALGGRRPGSPGRPNALPLGDIVAVAGLGGIGFTVSLLMNELALGHDPAIADEGTLAVIGASLAAAAIGAVVTAVRARHYRRDAATSGADAGK